MKTLLDSRPLLRGLRARLGFLAGLVAALFLTLDVRAVDRIGFGPDANVQSAAFGADGTLYFGGQFTKFGLQTGSAFQVDLGTGGIDRSFPPINGVVRAICPDGQGGWYIGGAFTSVGGVLRTNLAHIDSTGAVTAWQPRSPIDDRVDGITLGGNLIYFWGAVSKVNGVALRFVAAVGTDGELTSWRPLLSGGGVNTVAVSGSTVYVGGSSLILSGSGASPRHFMAFGTDGTLLPWDPNPSDEVNAIQIVGSSIYFGGAFGFIGGQSRPFIAELGLDGVAKNWPSKRPTARVRAISVDADNVYVVGDFAAFSGGGGTRNKAAAISRTTGLPTSFDPFAATAGTLEVRSVLATNNLVYLPGFFQSVSGVAQNHMAVVAPDGQLQSLAPDPSFGLWAVGIWGSKMVAGGDCRVCGGVARSGLAAIGPDGVLTSWAPTLTPAGSYQVFSIATSGSSVYFAGSFNSVNGTPRTGLAAVDQGGTLTSWNPTLGYVPSNMTLKLYNNAIYLGGGFTQVNGVGRSGLAAVDMSGSLLPWNPGCSGVPLAMEATNGVVYIAGNIDSVGGLTRNGLAAVDTDGNVTSWNPNPGSGTIRSIVPVGNTIYLGGSFTSIAGGARKGFAGVGTDGTLSPINLNLNASTVFGVGVFEDRLYVASTIGAYSGNPAGSVTCVGQDGTVFGWNADPGIGVQGVFGTATNLLIYGNFSSARSQLIAGQSGMYLAYFNPVDTTLPTVTSVTSSSTAGSYDVGSVIPIQVVFSDPVTVTGTPTLTLQNGGAGRVVNYSSGSGTTTLTFNYTVQAGDTSADLDYLSSSALSLNGGTIVETSSANTAVLTLPNPGAAGSLGANQGIQINTSAPTDISLSATVVAENSPLGTTIGSLSAIDADAGDTLSFTLVSGAGSADNAAFSISGSSLKTAAAVDYETKSAYGIRIRVTDSVGHVFEKVFTVSVTDINEAPSFSGYSLTVSSDATTILPVAKILGRTSDPENTARTFSLSTGTSAQGGTVQQVGTTLRYTPPAGYSGSDSFGINISDGVNSLPGTINITVGTQGAGNGLALISVTTVGSDVVLKFSGAAGARYQIQRSGNITAPATWTSLATVTADSSGFVSYTDVAPPSPSFWRTLTAP